MNMVSLEQSHEVMAKLATKADWSQVLVEQGQQIIENQNIGQEFTRFLLNSGCAPAREWEIWKTIKLGTGLRTADDFRTALKDRGFRVSGWADDILGKLEFKATESEEEVGLVRASVADLGFSEGATTEQIYSRAKERGLELCPAEVGPQFRLQYKDQPTDEWIRVAMEPIFDSVRDPYVFHVVYDHDGRWLSADYARPACFWAPGDLWVFRVSK